MIETLIASSVLIGSVCLIRYCGKGRIRPLFLYGLWGLVVLRLIIPWFYPLNQIIGQLTSRFSVMNAAEQLKNQVINHSPAADLAENIMYGVVRTYDTPVTPLEKAAGIDWQLLIMTVWILGSVVLTVWFLTVNIRFAKRLRKHRRCLFLAEDGFVGSGIQQNISKKLRKIPVYETSEIFSPCYLCHLGECAIYLPEGLAEDNSTEGKKRLSHILAHEICHARQKDEIWGIVRMGLLCYYWINPFVWAAAILSKKDCELACDEAAVALLGETERISYGRTLVYILEQKNSSLQFFYAGATIESGGNTMKERIKTLAFRKKYSAAAAAILAGCAVLLAACTFTGSKIPEEPENIPVETATSESVEESVVQESTEETALESQTEQIPVDNFLDVIEEQYLGEYIKLGLIMREGGTGKVQSPIYTQDDENNRLMIEAEFLDKDGTLLENLEYGWGGGEDTAIHFEYWDTEGQVSEIAIHAACNGSSYNLRYQVKEEKKPIEIPMNVELTGINGERAVLAAAKIYSNALVLHIDSIAEGITPFYENNVVLLKRKGLDDPSTYLGPVSVNTDRDSLRIIYRIERENVGNIEALACGQGGERETYPITPVTFVME